MYMNGERLKAVEAEWSRCCSSVDQHTCLLIFPPSSLYILLGVGIWQHDRVEIIPNEQGNRTTPSYVAFTDTERLIGDAAKNQARTGGSRCRKIGLGEGTSDAYPSYSIVCTFGNRFEGAQPTASACFPPM